eukprot:CAMPEP_0196738180 /NCGR_PEP_ID=MMETSP1091-20130531/15677_1 /TAXON_ID=302021 /ORGANISM="Rhodomonas sp., Strain CCMP768" /LENGTH=48 /DNA_ID= /DNA_START= /DNA_END= /DNA_ORIENTATION=
MIWEKHLFKRVESSALWNKKPELIRSAAGGGNEPQLARIESSSMNSVG